MSLFSGLSRPLKAAGLALIGLAIVAAVIGGVTVLNNGGSNDNTAAPTTSPAPPPESSVTPPPSPSLSPSPSPSPSASSQPPPPGTPPSSAPAGTSPTQGGQPPAGGQPGDQQASAKWVVVRVYNNSLIKGLAERAAADFRNAGWNVADVSNYPQGIIPETTAYFRPGTDEETAARALAAQFGMRAEPRFEGIQDSSPGVIVIVTNNYKGAEGKDGS
jgi:hypothetical protein